ncbi:MAG: LLM class F420-dependent oxidoreductase [Anaerolineae bacterium]|nr:LLM class F420-dependent oxidoreductase [Anaerolineae bacterium]
MKLGAVFPQNEIGEDPAIIRQYAQALEGLGLDYVMAYDHVLGACPDRPGWQAGYPYTHEHPFHEVMVLFAYLAGITQTLEFVTGVLIAPQRPAALIAKQAAQLDLLSGGRLRLGVGVGWNWAEMAALGYRFEDRGQRIDEQVQVMQLLWTQPLVRFSGKFHQLDEVGINPLPVQRPIPVWFGGSAEAVLQRMARLGAGWIPNTLSPEQAAPTLQKIRDYLREQGRHPAQFGVDVRFSLSRQPAETWPDLRAAWLELGATHFGLNTMGMGFTNLRQHLDALAAFARVMRA